MNEPVSVYIPNYQYAEYLPECLNSVCAQQYEPLDIVVMDDASTDNSWDILNEYANRDPRISIYRKETNQGHGNVNEGVSHTKGKYISILPADDKLSSNFWEITLSYFTDETIGFVRIAAMQFDDFKNKRGSKWDLAAWLDPKDILVSNKVYLASPVRREMFEILGGQKWNEVGIYGDWDFWIRAVLTGWKWKDCPEHLYWVRRHSKSISARRFSELLPGTIEWDNFQARYEKEIKELFGTSAGTYFSFVRKRMGATI